MTNIELENIGIYSWKDIAGIFKNPDLLLGNGFSIKINECFLYDSIFNHFLGKCNDDDIDRFNSFNTTNFENILNNLRIAYRVNRLFQIDTTLIERAANILKGGFITTISDIHPRTDNIDREILTKLSEELDDFGDIYTLNYDAMLYHIIMISKDRSENNNKVLAYNDYFWNIVSEQYLEFMGYQDYSNYKHVYYLHGALFLFRIEYRTFKIRRTYSNELINVIQNNIEKGRMPLFVSEGTSKDKINRIYDSDYLRFANKILSEPKDRLLIYGTSLSKADSHIIEAIKKSNCRIVYSIYTENKSKDNLVSEMKHYDKIFPNKIDYFIDSSTLFNS